MTVLFHEGLDQYIGDGVFISSSAFRWKRYSDGDLVRVPDIRPRCIKDGKCVFRSAGEAKHSATLATSRGAPMKHYLGDCGHWHTARRRKRGQRTD